MPAPPSKQPSPTQFHGGLIRTVVPWIILLALAPVLAVSAVSYLRMRAMLNAQVTDQLEVVVANHTRDFEEYAQHRREALSSLVETPGFTAALAAFAQPEGDPSSEKEKLRARMQAGLGSPNEPAFSYLLILDEQGEVLLSTLPEYERFSFRYSGLSTLIGSTGSASLYNPAPFVTNDLVLLTTRVYQEPVSRQNFTIVGLTQGRYPQTLLSQAENFFSGSNAYLFTGEDTVIGLGSGDRLSLYPNHQEQLAALRQFSGVSGVEEYRSQGDTSVMGYARWMPDLNLGLVIEVPTAVVYDQLRFMGSFLLLVLLGGGLITGLMVSVGMRRVVRPMEQLAGAVQRFAQGDWNRRIEVTRKDEIGLLAATFNRMADELSKMYHSLETKVEERNQQLRTAADVAQVVSSTTGRANILRQTVDLICERFELDFAGLYLLDDNGSYITARATAGWMSAQDQREGMETRIRTQSLFGKVIANNQSVVVSLPEGDATSKPETMLTDAYSCLVTPVSSGKQVLGLLEVQSIQRGAFPPEAVTVFKMVANQVANGLQNTRLVEGAQVDLRETTLLYAASRKVSQARTPLEVEHALSETLAQTSYIGVLMSHLDGQYIVTAVVDPLSTAMEKTLPRIALADERIARHLTGKSFLLLDDLDRAGDLYVLTAQFAKLGCQSAAILPIYSGGGIGLVLALGSRSAAPITQAAIGPYVSLAEVAANTIERLRVVATLEENLADLQTLAVIGQTISTATGLDELFTLLHEQINATAGGSIDLVMALYDPAAETIHFPYIVEDNKRLSAAPAPFGEGLTSELIRSRKPLLLGPNAQAEAEKLGARMVGQPVKSWLGVPLMVTNEVIGAMILQDTRKEGRFTESDLRLFTTLAPQVAVTVRNAQLLERMQTALKAFDQEHFLLNNLLETIPSEVAFKDRAGRYLRVSRMAAVRYGFDQPGQLVGKSDLDLPELAEQNTHALEQELMASGEGQPETVEPEGDKTGGERWWLASRLPMKDDLGGVVGLMSIRQDITALKQAERVSQKRSELLRTAAEIAREASATLNIEDLLSKMVYLIRDRFGFYHASVFLTDSLNEYAVLRESTGEAGEQMKKAGHRLAIGSQSIVGTCAGQGRALVVNHVAAALNYYPNPLLPNTRAELGIPLKIGEQVIGVIDVQSSQVDAFQPEDIQILQMLADQLAVAINNADLFVKTQENIAKHRFLHQITTAAAGANSPEEALKAAVQGLLTGMGSERVAVLLPDAQGYLEVRAAAGYEQADLSQMRKRPGEGLAGLVALGRQPILIRDRLTEPRYDEAETDMRSAVAVPILYSDLAAGVLCVESAQPAAFDENDQEILASLGSNLGAILANAQLVVQVRHQVEQQQALFEITNKIRRSTDIQTILETSTRELALAVKARRARIEITTGEGSPGFEPNFNGHHVERDTER